MALAQPNIWTKSTTGAWEEPFWSLGVNPSSTQVVLFTNDNSKTLWITGDTARQAPNSLSVNALVLSAPLNALNTLRLEAPGLPLRIADTFLLGENSFLQFANTCACPPIASKCRMIRRSFHEPGKRKLRFNHPISTPSQCAG